MCDNYIAIPVSGPSEGGPQVAMISDTQQWIRDKVVITEKYFLFVINIFHLFYLGAAGTVEAGAEAAESAQQHGVVVALDCVEWRDLGAEAGPLLVLPHHRAQLAHEEGILGTGRLL